MIALRRQIAAEVPGGGSHRVPYRFNDIDFEVHIQAGIDTGTGEAFAYFYSIDPETGLTPPVGIGFLPPEDGSGRGRGHFSYVIRHDPGLLSGTERPRSVSVMGIGSMSLIVRMVLCSQEESKACP